MSDKNYYQFDLDFQGKYIRGNCAINENISYFIIENPEIHLNDQGKYQVNPADNIIYLSKNKVACFYKIR